MRAKRIMGNSRYIQLINSYFILVIEMKCNQLAYVFCIVYNFHWPLLWKAVTLKGVWYSMPRLYHDTYRTNNKWSATNWYMSFALFIIFIDLCYGKRLPWRECDIPYRGYIMTHTAPIINGVQPTGICLLHCLWFSLTFLWKAATLKGVWYSMSMLYHDTYCTNN